MIHSQFHFTLSFCSDFFVLFFGQIVETKNFRGSKTVSDFVKAGGTNYKLLFDNCHDAADRMMDG